MQIIQKNVDYLIPYENNPRDNDKAVTYVANSIEEFGFKVPIVIDTDNVIVAGHTRIKAAKLLGLDTVPCIVADDLNEEQIRAFRLADNKVSEYATWDEELLTLELGSFEELDLAEFGFNTDESGGDFGVADEEDIDEFEDIEKLEKHYGVPYQGNKSRIADIIIHILPKGNRLVDLFGGGGRDYTLRNTCRQVELLLV